MQATLLMTSGLFRTAAGTVAERWLKSHGKEIQEYLTIRSRDVELGGEMYCYFAESVRRLPVEQLKRGPTPKARLYLVATGVVQLHELLAGQAAADEELPWLPLAPHLEAHYREAAELLRTGLPKDDAEILELYHVRQLSVAEVAYVLGATEEVATSRLKSAEAYAIMLIEERLGDELPALDKILEDAFALDPLPERQLDDDVIPPALPAGTVLAERYEIESHVARGAFGHVYRARDVLVPGHQVALKLLHHKAKSQAAREGAIRELSLLASVFHPSVVQFKDHGWFDDRLWFVMPWYHGETLHERILREPLAPEEAFRIFEQLARALAALHAAGIRHQDVKPDNIFLVDIHAGREGAESETLPVLLDLGGAAPQGDMALVGTPIYFSPEVADRFVDRDSESPLTAKADVFALALTLMHSLDPKSMEADADLEFDQFVRLRRECSPRVSKERAVGRYRRSFRRWLAKDPSSRPSAMAFGEELARLSGARPRTFPRTLGRGLLAAAGVVGLGAGIWVVPTSVSEVADEWVAQDELVQHSQHEIATLEGELDSAGRRAERLEEELTELRQAAEEFLDRPTPTTGSTEAVDPPADDE
ncbi:MAG: serine/threonine-protein kinase [Myxococcota bacterium]